eukprot:scaffold73947_cov37-Prasinocladus_malaysianus.AAC.1
MSALRATLSARVGSQVPRIVRLPTLVIFWAAGEMMASAPATDSDPQAVGGGAVLHCIDIELPLKAVALL